MNSVWVKKSPTDEISVPTMLKRLFGTAIAGKGDGKTIVVDVVGFK